MKYAIILFLTLSSFSLIAQSDGSGSIRWIKDLGISSLDVAFVGSDDNKFIWSYTKKHSGILQHQKKAGVQQLKVYDILKKEVETLDVAVEKNNWVINFKVYNGQLHSFMSCYDKQKNQVEYWHKAYQTSDMKEKSSWTLLGAKETDDLKSWGNNMLSVLSSEPNPKTGSIYLKVFNREFQNGYGLVVNQAGEIIRQREVQFDGTLPLLMDSAPERNQKFTPNELLTGDNDETLIQLIHNKELADKKNSMSQRDLKSGTLEVEFINLENGTTKQHNIGEASNCYFAGLLIESDNNEEVLVATASFLKKDNDPFKFATKEEIGIYSLFLVKEDTGAELMDEVDQVPIKGIFYEFSHGISTSARADNFGDKVLVSFLLRRHWQWMDYERLRMCAVVDVKNRKLIGHAPTIELNLDKSLTQMLYKVEQISYEKNNGVNIVAAFERFRIEAGGKLKKLTPYEKQKDKRFKKKIVPAFSQGFLERENDFLIVGRDGGLYIGTLKK